MTRCACCTAHNNADKVISELTHDRDLWYREFIELEGKHNKLVKFIKKILHEWECDPNEAESLLKEIGES